MQRGALTWERLYSGCIGDAGCMSSIALGFVVLIEEVLATAVESR